MERPRSQSWRLTATIPTILALLALLAPYPKAEDGYRLWLRYDRLPNNLTRSYRRIVNCLLLPGTSPTLTAARSELLNGLSGLFGKEIPTTTTSRTGALIAGTPVSSPIISRLRLPVDNLGTDGYLIRSVRIDGHAVTVIAAKTDQGVLYGAFHFLRLIQTSAPISGLEISEKPRLQLRMLNHWDNLDRSVERGYAGKSLWQWDSIPLHPDQRLTDYARSNASIGINGTVLNNVNADARILTPAYLSKVAVIAEIFRPYGLRVFLAARFSAPIDLGGLSTADPLAPEVKAWWKSKADEIYRLIPDFGGFIVKANSEGQPGPRTYGRNHVDGANMLADALEPHHGIVIWRAFVYDMRPGYDRAGAAYENLQPFDGMFAANVLLQVKNGPIDFQPREPFHPLFGAMPATQLMPELQITQEYLGFSNHLAFLAPMWREFLQADTWAKGRGTTVAKIIDGSIYHQTLTGIAGVANTGSDQNWTGHDLAQANWYAFGRLAWNPDLNSKRVAEEWVRMTLTREPQSRDKMISMLLQSHEAVVDYMTPLGLHHIMWGGHHYGPAPWWNKESRADWNPVYYHRADENGLGFDRTPTGSNTVNQYFGPVRNRYSNLETCPENLLLWFHHVSWDYRMRSGKTMWEELGLHYQRGVDWVRAARKTWNSLANTIDRERLLAVDRKLAIQERDAVHWRDACLLYFGTWSRRPLPPGVEGPQKTLDEYKATSLKW